ncbi:hypothetical protein MLD38_030366 [Melastoma candidum]|uniref:Uncharacterized protein n=1 Tax=Melastoma candidum TaxID=119954 RepID=A0ACB9MLJ6_9MYRT|nr:hypothetical protein MLD38_030366 [Melastoma candidum]
MAGSGGGGVDLESRGAVKSDRGPSSSSNFVVLDDEQTQWTSWLVPMIVVANVAVFIVVMYVNDCPRHGSGCVARFLGRFSFEPLRENPLFGPSSWTLEKLGALEREKVVHHHQGWRLITCIWLHAGIIHILANMLSLILIGIRLEQQFGFVRVGLIYMVSGFGGSVLSSLFIRSGISVGASGALFGLLGAMLSELLTNWSLYTNKVAALFTLLVVVVINLAIGILPRVDNFAHIGGFLTGFLLGFILLPRPQLGWLVRQNATVPGLVMSKYKAYQYVLWFTSLGLLISGLTVSLVMLLKGKNASEYCHWCHYLSCVPTSGWSCD